MNPHEKDNLTDVAEMAQEVEMQNAATEGRVVGDNGDIVTLNN